ncbi:hypothetical protein A0257_07370 [Hymenobacter psoromatis]|nr:hypothetical protein A0257_07370 [Hymenobacter psoromatis]
MTDNSVEPIATHVTDNVTAYYPTLIFRGLQPDVLTVRDYQKRVITQNNRLQAPEMEQLVTTYRW